MMNKPFIFYKITSKVTVGDTTTIFFDYVHSKNTEVEGYSLIPFVEPIEVIKMFEVESSNESLIEILSKFSEHLNEDVFAYEVNGLEEDE